MNEQLTIRDAVPPEVGELWTQLHAEAQENCAALKPQTSRRVLFIVIAASILFLVVALFSVNEFWFKPQEEARVAAATAQALALDASAQGTATAIAATATADAGKLAEEYLTATARADQDAANRAATATAEALQNQAAATAQAQANIATATAQAEAVRCQNIMLYDLEVAEEPDLSPSLQTIWVTDKPWPSVYAEWVVTNTSTCEWANVLLKDLDRRELTINLLRDGEELERLLPGETATVRLAFASSPAPSKGEWILVVNGLSLFDAPSLHLDLGEQAWVIAVTPTPTPTPTATPTLTPTPTLEPTPTPIPTSCPIQCDRRKKDPNCVDGFATVCEYEDYNCRPVCP